MIRHRTLEIDGVELFYRESGEEGAPAIVLLHGFPSSSYTFRRLMLRLGDDFRCVAPDLPGFGYSGGPPASEFAYTFDHLAAVTTRFLDRLGLDRFSLYVFDFGAPVGFRIAAAQPKRIEALIVQNGNIYEEGLSPATESFQAYWRNRPAHEQAMRGLLTREMTKFQYTHGACDPEQLEPDSWTLDQHFLELPGRDQAMLDLFYDYRTNVESYPRWQAYLRQHRPPTLVVWGRNDPFFTSHGATAFRRDLPEAEVHLLDTGHFALEEKDDEIAVHIRRFLEERVEAQPRERSRKREPAERSSGSRRGTIGATGPSTRKLRAQTPEQVIELFAESLNKGDLDGALSLYEPNAAFAPQPGQVVVGREAIREALRGFLALRPAITGEIQKVVAADDVALVVNKWSLEGTKPDGERLTMSGTSADVVRRQPEGHWLVVVDEPFGV